MIPISPEFQTIRGQVTAVEYTCPNTNESVSTRPGELSGDSGRGVSTEVYKCPSCGLRHLSIKVARSDWEYERPEEPGR